MSSSLSKPVQNIPNVRHVEDLEGICDAIRVKILEVLDFLGEKYKGHPGGSLSIVEILTALYFMCLRVDPANPEWDGRDRFILSKGHGCLALYVVLAFRGFFDPKLLFTFRHVNSQLQGHPDMRKTPGIDMTSGSLGNGIAAGVGMALTFKAQERSNHVFVLVGDGELQEGVIWEAAMTAGKFQLGNLLVIVDCNGLQGSGPVHEVMPLYPLAKKWEAFNWKVMEADGHDLYQLVHSIGVARREKDRPTVILAHTIKGKGVSFMENDNSWHQRALLPESNGSAASQMTADWCYQSTRLAAGETLLAMAHEGRDFVVLTADSSLSMGIKPLLDEYPKRGFELGIAEQNLIMTAAGMASTGKMVFACTYSIFASLRACEQLRTFIAYPGLNVKILAGLCGLSAGIEGATHLAVEDIGILRCIPDLVILNPADAVSARQAIRAAAEFPGPVYIRLGRDPSPVLDVWDSSFEIGKGRILLKGGVQAVFFTTGLITVEVLQAAIELERERTRCTVVEFPTLKPLDGGLVLGMARQAEFLFVVEEHNILGGLGTAVMELLGEADPRTVERIGIPDCYLESGTIEELRMKYGLTTHCIINRVRRCLGDIPRQAVVHEEGGKHGIKEPQR